MKCMVPSPQAPRRPRGPAEVHARALSTRARFLPKGKGHIESTPAGTPASASPRCLRRACASSSAWRAWAAWQASTAGSVVDLPPPCAATALGHRVLAEDELEGPHHFRLQRTPLVVHEGGLPLRAAALLGACMSPGNIATRSPPPSRGPRGWPRWCAQPQQLQRWGAPVWGRLGLARLQTNLAGGAAGPKRFKRTVAGTCQPHVAQ